MKFKRILYSFVLFFLPAIAILVITRNNSNMLITFSFIILFVVLGYIFGNIFWAQLVSKYILKVDLYSQYTGNPGGTNFTRVHGFKIGLLVYILDILKGFIPGLICGILILVTTRWTSWLNHPNSGAWFLTNGYSLFGVILGTAYPLIQNKGGKCTAAFIGGITALNPFLLVIFVICWIFINILTKYVSLASIFSSLICILVSLIPFIGNTIWLYGLPCGHLGLSININIITTSCIAFASLVIIIRHKSNIVAIIKHQEATSPFYKMYLIILLKLKIIKPKTKFHNELLTKYKGKYVEGKIQNKKQ